jgi:hypothetical protein
MRSITLISFVVCILSSGCAAPASGIRTSDVRAEPRLVSVIDTHARRPAPRLTAERSDGTD